jgi:Ca-activated chloride channel homolog
MEPVEIAQPELEPEWPPREEGWGEPVYLSNDDTMSLSSAQRVAYAIDNVLPLPPQHVRPHELLNYFSFGTAPVQPGHDFSVTAEIAPSSRQPGLYSLALGVAGRPVGRAGRRNAVLTLVVDVSGSMRKEGRMEYLKRGLLRMVRELETGDLVHVVTFDHNVCVPLQNYVVGRDDPQVLTRTIHALRPAGYTNLHAGLLRGYDLADRAYQPSYTNRLLLITDALANRGVTDAKTLSLVSDWYDSRRIRLSGIGVGSDFDDAMLDRLTETGRGAYVFLGSPAEVDAVFGHRFVSLIETTANDVHFRLHLPPSLRMQIFHGEEASTVKKEVQAVHFFADTSVMLLSELEAWQGELRAQDDIMLEIDYQHPETGEPMVEEYAISLSDAQQSIRNLRKAELITHFIDGVARVAARGAPSQWQPKPGTWRDAESATDCARTRNELREIVGESDADAEIRRVFGLWDGLCSRFATSGEIRPPRKDALERDAWPGASRG